MSLLIAIGSLYELPRKVTKVYSSGGAGRPALCGTESPFCQSGSHGSLEEGAGPTDSGKSRVKMFKDGEMAQQLRS